MPDASTALGSEAIRRFLTFRVVERRYAIAAYEAAEVIRLPSVARIPQSPRALLGVANLRGNVVPLVDLAGLLGLPVERARSDAARAVVLDAAAPLALVVDSIEALLSVPAERVETHEAELGALSGERLRGAFDAGGNVTKVLDVGALIGAAFGQRESAKPRARPKKAAAAKAPAVRAESVDERTLLVTFEVANQEFALDLDAVQEIVHAPQALMRVPRAEALALGVTALRDRLLPILSLRGLLGFPPAERSDGREKVVVVRVGGAPVGLVADRARAILSAPRSSIDEVPAALAARSGGESCIKAVYRGDGGRRLISILDTGQLFREDVMQRLRDGADAAVEPALPSAAAGERTFLVFRLGDDDYALPIESVDEVAEVPAKIARLPKTPKFLEGVVSVRGEVVPVIDQRRRFDMPALVNASGRRLIVLRSAKHRAGIIVDRVSELLRVPPDALAPAPELTDEIGRLVHGVINLPSLERIVLVLQPSELLTPAERGLLDKFTTSEQTKRDQSPGGR